MKTPLIFIPFVLGAALWASASEYSMVWQDGNQKLLSRIEETLWADGVRTQDPHYLMVLETGMNHLENNVWVPSQEIFEPVQGGAAAIHGGKEPFKSPAAALVKHTMTINWNCCKNNGMGFYFDSPTVVTSKKP